MALTSELRTCTQCHPYLAFATLRELFNALRLGAIMVTVVIGFASHNDASSTHLEFTLGSVWKTLHLCPLQRYIQCSFICVLSDVAKLNVCGGTAAGFCAWETIDILRNVIDDRKTGEYI